MDKQYLVEKIELALVKIDQGYLNYVKGLLRDALIELSKPDEGEMAVNPPRKSVPLAMFEEYAKEILDMAPGAPWLASIVLLAKQIAARHGYGVTE